LKEKLAVVPPGIAQSEKEKEKAQTIMLILLQMQYRKLSSRECSEIEMVKTTTKNEKEEFHYAAKKDSTNPVPSKTTSYSFFSNLLPFMINN